MHDDHPPGDKPFRARGAIVVARARFFKHISERVVPRPQAESCRARSSQVRIGSARIERAFVEVDVGPVGNGLKPVTWDVSLDRDAA